MKVKTKTRFTDLKEKIVREVDDIFEVSDTRYEQVKLYVEKIEEKPKENEKEKNVKEIENKKKAK